MNPKGLQNKIHSLHILAIDLTPGREGGTWLGLSKTGKFAVLLNILTKQRPATKGRGMVPLVFMGLFTCNHIWFTILILLNATGALKFLEPGGGGGEGGCVI